MSNKVKLRNKRLKYTRYELVNMVKDKMKSYSDAVKFSEEFKLDIELLNKLLDYPKIISFEMYKLISTITNMSIKELTKIEVYEAMPDFRGNAENSSGLEEFLLFSNNLFEEMIINLKIRG